MMLLIGHWYEHRESVAEAGSLAKVTDAADALLWMWRVPEVA